MNLTRLVLRAPNRPILWMATALHAVWGLLMVLNPGDVARTVGLAPFSEYPEAYGLLLLASTFSAASALIHEARGFAPNKWTFWSFIPQQALLTVSAFSVLYYVIEGFYASRSGPTIRWFIFADQLPKLLLALLHPFGILRMHRSILPEGVEAGE